MTRKHLFACLLLGAAGALALVSLSDGGEPRPWTVVEQPRPSATAFKINVDSGECNPPDSALRIEVSEGVESVIVTALVDEGSGTSDACLSSLVGTVSLDAPLGQRRLLQGS